MATTADTPVRDAAPVRTIRGQKVEIPGITPVIERAPLRDELRALSRIRPWRAAAGLGFHYAVIVAAFSVALWWPHWAVWLVAAVAIGTRQVALSVIMHDASHNRLFPGRRWNRLAGELICAPAGVYFQAWKQDHLAHHAYLGSPLDPDVAILHKTGHHDAAYAHASSHARGGWRGLRQAIIKHLADTLLVVFMPNGGRVQLGWRERAAYIAFGLGFLGVVALFNLWLPVLCLWFVPFVLFVGFSTKVRGIAEHAETVFEDELTSSRYVEAGWLERLFICPCNINYHPHHHIFPNVPYYNLPALHARMMQIPAFRERAVIDHGYGRWVRAALGIGSPADNAAAKAAAHH